MKPFLPRVVAGARRIALLALLAGAGVAPECRAAGATGIWEGPVAAYESDGPAPASETAACVLRWIWVSERIGQPRSGAPVRVPLFFAAGECPDPSAVALVRWPSREPVPVQCDDLRRGPDGGVARMHLWFRTDQAADATERWALVRRGAGDFAPVARAVPARLVQGQLQVTAADTLMVFTATPERRGALAALALHGGPALLFPGGAGARLTRRQGGGTEILLAPEDAGTLVWGSGPVFAKVSVQQRARDGSRVEQVYRLFADGVVNLVQTVTPADDRAPFAIAEQDFIAGRLVTTGQLALGHQSACLVEALENEHPGYQVDGLIQRRSPRGWLIVPGSLGGKAGRVAVDREGFHLQGPGGLARSEAMAAKGTVRAFWAEVSLVPAAREAGRLQRDRLLAAGQPLVGVVERPGVTRALAVARLQDNIREMKPVGWVNETVARELAGSKAPFPRRRWQSESDPEHWLAAARQAEAKVTRNGSQPLGESDKGRAAGPLDPYHITYDSTPLAWWLSDGRLADPIRAALGARLEAVRRHLGRVDRGGWPYLDVFARAQNMQMGPPLLALADAGADPALRAFYRDQLAAPALAAVMLRGQRPYQGKAQFKPEESDALYQGVVDFMLRSTELVLNESLGFHPVAFGRYLDAVDVNADLYHPSHAREAGATAAPARANFFRLQSHLHRWLSWGPAPYLALLQKPGSDGAVPGATEAWRFADGLAGQWKNWPDQSWMFLATVLPGLTPGYQPPVRPPPVRALRLTRNGTHCAVTWEAPGGAKGYRIYRQRAGQPLVWLNSPYLPPAPEAGGETTWSDAGYQSGDHYLVQVVGATGLSGWQ